MSSLSEARKFSWEGDSEGMRTLAVADDRGLTGTYRRGAMRWPLERGVTLISSRTAAPNFVVGLVGDVWGWACVHITHGIIPTSLGVFDDLTNRFMCLVTMG